MEVDISTASAVRTRPGAASFARLGRHFAARSGRFPRPFYASAAVALMLLAGPAPALAETKALNNCTPAADWGSFEPATAERVVELVNAHRRSRGLGELTVSPALTRAANWKALHMAKFNYLEHSDLGVGPGRTPWERAIDCGYSSPSRVYENIAAGWASMDEAQQIVEGWLNSPGHRTQIERPEFVATGVGVATSPRGDTYWVQLFGRDRDSSPGPVTQSATSDQGRTSFGMPVLLSVLDNDGPLVAIHSLVAGPKYGRVQVAGRRLRYTPAPGFSGSDSFSYSVAGISGDRANARVTVTVAPLTLRASVPATVSGRALATQHLVYSVEGRAALRYRLYRVGQTRPLRTSAPRVLTNATARVSLKAVFGNVAATRGRYRLDVITDGGPTRALSFRVT